MKHRRNYETSQVRVGESFMLFASFVVTISSIQCIPSWVSWHVMRLHQGGASSFREPGRKGRRDSGVGQRYLGRGRDRCFASFCRLMALNPSSFHFFHVSSKVTCFAMRYSSSSLVACNGDISIGHPQRVRCLRNAEQCVCGVKRALVHVSSASSLWDITSVQDEEWWLAQFPLNRSSVQREKLHAHSAVCWDMLGGIG